MEATANYEDLRGALRASVVSFPLTRATLGDVRLRVSSDSPFAATDGGLRGSLRAFELIGEDGMPTAALLADFQSYGLELPGREAQKVDTKPIATGNAGAIFDEFFRAAAALGLELTLQTAGNRLRGRLGPATYQQLVAPGGLSGFVESIGRYDVVDDHGRHIVRARHEKGA